MKSSRARENFDAFPSRFTNICQPQALQKLFACFVVFKSKKVGTKDNSTVQFKEWPEVSLIRAYYFN